MTDFLFVFLAIFTIGCALAVVLNRNVVNGAMALLLCLVGVAGLFIRLDAFLLSFLLLLVYAGAVVALFLFIIMLLDVHGIAQAPRKRSSWVAAIAAGVLLLVGVASLIEKGHLSYARVSGPAVGSTLKEYAYPLFTTYLLPVQVVGFLLLIAMIGVIVLSQKSGGKDRA